MIRLIQNDLLCNAIRLLEIQQRSYKIEAEIIGFKDLPPLFETKDKLMADQAKYLAYIENGLIVGFLAYEVDDQTLEIHKLVVDPDCFRKGIASKLLDYLILEAHDINLMIVSTGADNNPAINLYKNKGFAVTHASIIEETLKIAHLKRIMD
ncbi:MAG: GNAT family N-acetyltransferase [Candidatus Cloacimonetes bacterium]|nr:GNAT family N-acetyltransferase [Candidatus Cloacimonadota bacterium]